MPKEKKNKLVVSEKTTQEEEVVKEQITVGEPKKNTEDSLPKEYTYSFINEIALIEQVPESLALKFDSPESKELERFSVFKESSKENPDMFLDPELAYSLTDEGKPIDDNLIITDDGKIEEKPPRRLGRTIRGSIVPVLTDEEMKEEFSAKNYKKKPGKTIPILLFIIALLLLLFVAFRFFSYFYQGQQGNSILHTFYNNDIVKMILAPFYSLDEMLFSTYGGGDGYFTWNNVKFDGQMLAGTMMVFYIAFNIFLLIGMFFYAIRKASGNSIAQRAANRARKRYMKDVENNTIRSEYTISKSGEIIPILTEEERKDEFAWKHYVGKKPVVRVVFGVLFAFIALFILTLRFGWFFATDQNGVMKTNNALFDFFYTTPYMKVWVVPMVEFISGIDTWCFNLLFGQGTNQDVILSKFINGVDFTRANLLTLLCLVFIFFNVIIILLALMTFITYLFRKPRAAARARRAETRYLQDIADTEYVAGNLNPDELSELAAESNQEIVELLGEDVLIKTIAVFDKVIYTDIDTSDVEGSITYEALEDQSSGVEELENFNEPMLEDEIYQDATQSIVAPEDNIYQDSNDTLDTLEQEVLNQEVLHSSYEEIEVDHIANFDSLGELDALNYQDRDGIIYFDEDGIATVQQILSEDEISESPLAVKVSETPSYALVDEENTIREDDFYLLETSTLTPIEKVLPYDLMTDQQQVEDQEITVDTPIEGVSEEMNESRALRDALILNALDRFELVPVDDSEYPDESIALIEQEQPVEEQVEEEPIEETSTTLVVAPTEEVLQVEETHPETEEETVEPVKEFKLQDRVDLAPLEEVLPLVDEDEVLTKDEIELLYSTSEDNDDFVPENREEVTEFIPLEEIVDKPIEEEVLATEETEEPISEEVVEEELAPLEEVEPLEEFVTEEEQEVAEPEEVSPLFLDNEEVAPLEEVEPLEESIETLPESAEEETSSDVELAPLEEVEPLVDEDTPVPAELDENFLASQEPIEETKEELLAPVVPEDITDEVSEGEEEQLSFDPYANEQLESNNLLDQNDEESLAPLEEVEPLEEELEEDNSNNLVEQDEIDPESEELLDPVIIPDQVRYQEELPEGEPEQRFADEEDEINPLFDQIDDSEEQVQEQEELAPLEEVDSDENRLLGQDEIDEDKEELLDPVSTPDREVYHEEEKELPEERFSDDEGEDNTLYSQVADEEPVKEESIPSLEEVEPISEELSSDSDEDNSLLDQEEFDPEQEELLDPVVIPDQVKYHENLPEELPEERFDDGDDEENVLVSQEDEQDTTSPIEASPLEEVEPLEETSTDEDEDNSLFNQDEIDPEQEELLDPVLTPDRVVYHEDDKELPEERFLDSDDEDNVLVKQLILPEDIEAKTITNASGIKSTVKHMGPLAFNPNLKRPGPSGPINPIKVVAPIEKEEEKPVEPEQPKINPNVVLLHQIDERSKPKEIKPVKFKKVRFDLKKFKVKTYEGDISPEDAFMLGVTKVNPVVNPTFQNQKDVPEWKRRRLEKERRDSAKKGYVSDAKQVSDLSANKSKDEHKFDKTPSDFNSLREYNKAKKEFYAELKLKELSGELDKEKETEIKPKAPIKVVAPIKKQEEAPSQTEEKKEEVKPLQPRIIKPLNPGFKPHAPVNTNPVNPIKPVGPVNTNNIKPTNIKPVGVPPKGPVSPVKPIKPLDPNKK